MMITQSRKLDQTHPRTQRKTLVFWIQLTLSGLLVGEGFAYSSQPVELTTYKTHSRLILNFDGSVSVSLRKTPEGFEMSLPGLSLTDLGIPMGGEKAVKQSLSRLRDTRVTEIRLKEDSQGVKVSGRWVFPKGIHALADPVMDTFDFRDQGSARFTLDFWPRPGLTQIQLSNLKLKEKHDLLLQKIKADAEIRVSRQLAVEKKRAEYQDASYFCTVPMSDENDIFLKFNPAHKKVNFSIWFPTVTPDSRYTYLEPAGDSREIKYILLAKKFYTNGDFALVLRSLDFFESEFPRSEFLSEERFLKANALLKLGHSEASFDILKGLMRDFPKHPVALQGALFMALRSINQGSHVSAVQTFLWLIDHYGQGQLAWVFHLGAAESLFELGQVERASREYQWVIEKAPTMENRAEAALRLGDLYLRKFQYERALTAYYQGLGQFEKYEGSFPEAFLNRGETLYHLGQMEKAKKEFDTFLSRFPNHPEGWRATFRLGEIAGRDPKGLGQNSEVFRAQLLATINRFPMSPGAVLARLRLVPCADHGGFDLPGQERFFSDDAIRYDGGGIVVMKDYPDFRALSHLRALWTLGQPDQIFGLAIEELKYSKSPSLRSLLKLVANEAFRKMILQLIDQDKGYQALNFYVEQSPLLPPSDHELDTDFLMTLSQIASNLHLAQLADEILEHHKKMSAPSRALASSDLDSKNKNAERDFASAKALWVSILGPLQRPHPQLSDQIQRIKSLLDKVNGGSPYTFAKELILGLLEEREGNLTAAIQHASQAKLMGQSPRLDAWLASLHSKSKDSAIALSLYMALEKKIAAAVPATEELKREEVVEQTLAVPLTPDLTSILLAEAQIYESDARWGEAAATYARVLDLGSTSNRVLYGLSRSLDLGGNPLDKKRAKDALQKVANSDPKAGDEIFWKKLALENLANQETHLSIQKIAKEGK